MEKTASARAPLGFDIKSSHLPLVALVLKTTDLNRLNTEFQQRFGGMPGFFDQDGVIIDLSNVCSPGHQEPAPGLQTPLEFAVLNDMLRAHHLRPVAVRGGNDKQIAAALSTGLVHTHVPLPPRKQQAPAHVVEQERPKALCEPPAGALVIDRQVRCGQQIYARGRDLVVMAMVNPGAEIVSDGHIHVYAPLRGKAIAGANGNCDARIFSLNMAPELLSIAGTYCTGDQRLPMSMHGKAAQFRVKLGSAGRELSAVLING
jgi:septum site-determining protein MinC